VLLDLMRAEGQLTELRLRVEAVAQDLADQECARDVGAVLVAAGLDDPGHAHRDVLLSQGFERWEKVRAGLAAGDFTSEHARVIVRILDTLPDDIPTGVVALAEQQLCDWATHYAPREIRRLGQRIVSVVAPELGEAAEARALERLEEEAEQKACMSITPQGDGTTRIHGLVPEAVGVRLRTVLESFAQPRIAALDADGKTRPRGRLMAQALAELLERIDPKRLPAHGGDATTVLVTLSLEHLRSELGLAEMADGTLITASEARRLACTAKIIPAVLGTSSELLDLGRAKRLYSRGQRKALRIRDKHCRAEGCTVPATWCDAHHATPWSHGGKTDLDNAVLLCGHHHRRAHDPRYESTRLPNDDSATTDDGEIRRQPKRAYRRL
jgi:hypothetical protein